MKTRCGFVSNSSSSSFIVAFPAPKDGRKWFGTHEIKKLLFGDLPYIKDLSYMDYENGKNPEEPPDEYKYSTQIIAELICQQQHREPNIDGKTFKRLSLFCLRERIIDTLLSGWYDIDEELDLSDEDRKKLIEEKADEFIEKNKECLIYIFDFSDNDGPFHATLEHGNIFKNLPHLYVSNH